MTTLSFEVVSRFQPPIDANKLLYTPLPEELTYQHSRCYEVQVEGDVEAAKAYLRAVLVDEISQNVVESGQPALSGELFSVSYGIKPGALDLEKEAILTNYRGRQGLAFQVEGLTISQKYYIFGTPKATKEELAARFANDICNPAIHRWSIA